MYFDWLFPSHDQKGFSTFCEEHCLILGILSVIPKTEYSQGLSRIWKKFDKFDYAWPQFANLGEQPIKIHELYQDWTANEPATENTFGYTERYCEYKWMPSTVAGDFRAGQSLDHMHMARQFASAPSLNTSFIEADPRHDIFAVETESVHKLYIQLWHNLKAIRPLPAYANPRL